MGQVRSNPSTEERTAILSRHRCLRERLCQDVHGVPLLFRYPLVEAMDTLTRQGMCQSKHSRQTTDSSRANTLKWFNKDNLHPLAFTLYGQFALICNLHNGRKIIPSATDASDQNAPIGSYCARLTKYLQRSENIGEFQNKQTMS